MLYYRFSHKKDTHKFNYWYDIAVEKANAGDYDMQAMLCTDLGHVMDNGQYDGLFDQSTVEKFASSYLPRIIMAKNNGDPNARYAYAHHLHNRKNLVVPVLTNEEREEKLHYAINAGFTDACYVLISHKNMVRYIKNKGTVILPPYVTQEWQDYMKDELSLYKLGAKLYNGCMAGYCQFRIADMYESGDLVSKDEAVAQHWYKKSLENGYFPSKYHLKTF